MTSATANTLSPAHLFHVGDTIAVVTGGGTGLGLMMAKALASGGAKVYILGRRLDVLQKAAQDAMAEINGNNSTGSGSGSSSGSGSIVPLQCSVTSKEELQRAVDHIAAQDAKIHLLINNAGIATPNLEPHPQRPNPKWDVKRMRDFWFNKAFEDYAALFETNTTAALQTSFAFLELLDKGNQARQAEMEAARGPSYHGPHDFVRSQIIAMSSVGGFGRDNSAFCYGASKAGTTHMMKNLSTYLIPWKIRVNVVAPGYFNTEMMGTFYKSTRGKLPRSIAPEERFGEMQDIGGTIVWLASRAGSYCNGNVLLIDGGYCAAHTATY
ncbi:short chain dehydrogenase/reductase [Cordyceps fumosorosea ARSEF 2679]|uniref:Short chain dehydrogenase/reductase n=1 Tax=Cordyceps fumosorosea (strain ARSEF 2679) TaxID=1081104 RepID=A0A167FCH4_CORFA|nr:short chain dehydrogenase/reductase [Cordyceps fumosorosea ARSEF 2679]OAA45081.1 short chain dehydrogenase/reductase [Cordyceps fumosorosea ARSEF 2679]